MTAPAGEATLPGRLRLKSQGDFRAAYGRGRRASGHWVTVVVRPHRTGERPDPTPRVGVSVSKEHGRAVRRNKIKRLLREAFRLERARLPQGVDVVLIPKRRDEPLPLVELRRELSRLVEKALRSPPRGPRRRGGKGGRR